MTSTLPLGMLLEWLDTESRIRENADIHMYWDHIKLEDWKLFVHTFSSFAPRLSFTCTLQSNTHSCTVQVQVQWQLLDSSCG